MKQAGQIMLVRFPQADREAGNRRPALLLGQLPGDDDDWLLGMISSPTRHSTPKSMRASKHMPPTSLKAV
jgi:hypothetical protein